MPATRRDALDRLAAFLPQAGRTYATQRNHDFGPGQHDRVSRLSAAIRHRLITEPEVLRAVLARHSLEQADKFVQEVCWRTYWKGWLEMRPQVWHQFLAQRDLDRDQLSSNESRRMAVADAEAGRTGIEGFDDWARELVETGYLHNHARMWFASIWIFTLKLPWTLGADFFLRHLLDADPASNTLSWRWVAGLQTRGKTYLARADNIRTYTDGRFNPDGLASEAPAIDGPEPPEAGLLRPARSADECLAMDALLLIHPEDLHPESLMPDSFRPESVLAFSSVDAPEAWPFGERARDFVIAATEDACQRAQKHFSVTPHRIETISAAAVIECARAAGVDTILTADAPIGPVADAVNALEAEIEQAGLSLIRVRRPWDAAAWPHAKRGFFPFKKKIPALLKKLELICDG